MIFRTLTVLTLGMLLCGAVSAASEHSHDDGHEHSRHEHGHSGQRAHVHGLASLSVVADGNKLLVELDSPAANILGFEHAPASRQEQLAAAQALALLRDGTELFVPTPGAACRQIAVDIDAPQLEPHPPSAAHNDIRAEYQFECQQPGALESMATRLFKAFPALEEVRVQFISAAGQGATRLTPASSVLGLR